MSQKIALFVLVLFISVSARAQTEVKQHTVSIDSATGKTTVSDETIIKKEEDITPYTDMVNINPLKFFIAYNMTWYHKIANNAAVGIGAEFGALHENTAWGMNAEFRFYPSKKSMHGFYFAPNISYVQATNVDYYFYDGYGSYTARTMTAGMLLGWQWFPGSDFSIGLALGADAYIPLNTSHADSYDLLGGIYGSGVYPAIRFDIGYAW